MARSSPPVYVLPLDFSKYFRLFRALCVFQNDFVACRNTTWRHATFRTGVKLLQISVVLFPQAPSPTARRAVVGAGICLVPGTVHNEERSIPRACGGLGSLHFGPVFYMRSAHGLASGKKLARNTSRECRGTKVSELKGGIPPVAFDPPIVFFPWRCGPRGRATGSK